MMYATFTQRYIMYHIIINNKTVQSPSDERIAWANYRALCRDYKNKPYSIKLKLNEELLHAKAADLQLLDNVDQFTANDVLKHIMESYKINITTLKKLIKTSELELSNSRIDGWIKKVDDRKFIQMYHDELCVVLDLIIDYIQVESGYSPRNLKKLISSTGLSQVKFSEAMGESVKSVEGWVADPDKKMHRSMSYDNWKKLNKKVQDYLATCIY